MPSSSQTLDHARLFAALPARLLILQPDAPRFTIITASEAYLDATGTRLAEMIGRGIFEVFPDAVDNPANDGPALLRASLGRVHATGETDRMPMVRYDVQNASGSGWDERHWTPINSPVLDAEGRLLYIVHRVEDATEFVRNARASAEQRERNESLQQRLQGMQLELLRHSEELHRTNRRLAESEQHSRALLGNLQGMVYRVQTRPPWHFLYVSEGVERLCGYPPAHFVEQHQPWASIMLAEDIARVDAELAAQAAAGRPLLVEYRIRHRDGSVRWVEGRVRTAESAADVFEGTVFDIDDRKRAEQALAETQAQLRDREQRLKATIQATPGLFWTALGDGTVDFVNDASRHLFGVEPAQMLGQDWQPLIRSDHRARVGQLYRHSIDTGEPYRAEMPMITSSGSYRWISVSATAHRDAEGRVERWYGSAVDIDEVKLAQARAEEASRAKSVFLSTMSHEIRTPLNAVLGFSGLLADTELAAQQRDFVNSIRASGDHLLGVINDILDFSKLESGSLGLDYAPCDLRKVVEAALDLVASQAAPKNLELLYRIDDEVPPACLVDQARLRQVLANLLSNAVKFTSAGEVEVHISAQALGGDQYGFEFRVRDTGIGIPAEALGRLFRDFSQVDDSVARRFGGTGLGLAISKRLVEAHGGRMCVSSEPGVGSVFSFHITTRGCESLPVIPETTADSLRGRRVLLVDDNRANLQILDLLARRWGMDPVAVDDPIRAIALARDALDQQRPFELAILDHQMPELDGLQLTQRLHALAPLPVLLLTSLGTTLSSAHATGARVAAVQSKPMHRSALFETLCAMLAPRAASPLTGAADLPAHAVPPLKLLLAEDNLVNRKVAQLLLRKLGYAHIDIAVNGLEAVDAVRSGQYDVVLMDVQMPVLDGLVATRRIRRELAAPRQPQIVAMTANAMTEDREACLAVGMDDYLSKPIDAALLGEALLRAAGRRGFLSPAPLTVRRGPREDADARARRIADQVLASGGEMGALMRRIDWAQSPVGPVYSWPQSLRTALSIVLTQKHPMFLWWGRELIQFYNDAYRPILGSTKHPAAMGQRGRECWSDIWDVIGPMVSAVMNRGESTMVQRGLLCLHRNGYFEEGYYSYGYSAIRDESGGIGGILVACSEDTADVIAARRASLLLALHDPQDLDGIQPLLAAACNDLPFVLVYRLDDAGHGAQLLCSVGLPAGHAAAPRELRVDTACWPVFDCLRGQRNLLRENLRDLPTLAPWPESPQRALLLPLSASCVLVAGISARLPFDAAYELFLGRLATRLATLVQRAPG